MQYALNKFYTHPAKSDQELSVFEHGEHTFFLSKWICEKLGEKFTPEIGVSALLHDVGKLENHPDNIGERWTHGPFSEKWIDAISEDERYDNLMELVEEYVDGDVGKDEMEVAKAVAEGHHSIKDVSLFSAKPKLYIPLIADALASVLEKGYRGKIRDLLGSAEGFVKGFTLDKINNLKPISEGEKIEGLLDEEIHSIDFPSGRAGDVLASMAVVKVIGEDIEERLIYQDKSTLMINSDVEEIKELLMEDNEWKKIEFEKLIENVFGDSFSEVIVGEVGTPRIPFSRSKEGVGSYTPQNATNFNPANLRPLLFTEDLTNKLAAKYMYHTEYEPSFRDLDINVEGWVEKIKEEGVDAVHDLYSEVRETILSKESIPLPPDLENPNEWANKKFDIKKWKPTGNAEEVFGDIFDDYPCLKYFTNYWHTVISALRLYEYRKEVKESEEFFVDLEQIARIDNSRVGKKPGQECSICMKNPATIESKGVITPLPQGPSQWRLEKGSSNSGLKERNGNIEICRWCYFVGLITFPFRTVIEEDQALNHSEDMVFFRGPMSKEKMENVLEFLGSYRYEPDECEEDNEAEISEQLSEFVEDGGDPTPLVDMVTSFFDPPKGYILEPLKSLDTVLGLKIFIGDLRSNIDETYRLYPIASTIYSFIESGVVRPVEMIHGDPLTALVGTAEEKKQTEKDRVQNIGYTVGNLEKRVDLYEEKEYGDVKELKELQSNFDPTLFEGYDPTIILEGENHDFKYLQRAANAFRLIQRYGWYESQGNRNYSWDLASLFMKNPRLVSDLLFNRMRKGQNDDGRPNPVGSTKTMELIYMVEQSSEEIGSNEEFKRNSGLWMSKYLIDNDLVDRARSLIVKEGGEFGKRSHDFTDPLHKAAVSGDIREWVDTIENLSRRVARDEESSRELPLSSDEVYPLSAFAEAFHQECMERNLLVEEVLSDIDSMAQHLHFSVAHEIIERDEIDTFYRKLVEKHGLEPEPEEYEEE